MSVQIIEGDCLATLRALPDASHQCCVTSPPYYCLRDYGHAGQIGLEATPDDYIARMVGVFREVRRVLRDDGTLWLNVGDSYNGGGVGGGASKGAALAGSSNRDRQGEERKTLRVGSAKPKDILMIPAILALALRADGWFLRSAIVWHKPNPMPESVRDRPTSAYEHVFLLTKRAAYYYDAEAIAEECRGASGAEGRRVVRVATPKNAAMGLKPTRKYDHELKGGRNARNVWTIATQPYSGAHFATMPPELAERCIKAGSKPGDHVLDPFGGAGTTGLVADRLGRNATLCELNPEYARLARERIAADAPLLAEIA